jgi:hypothetical protein
MDMKMKDFLVRPFFDDSKPCFSPQQLYFAVGAGVESMETFVS